MVNYTAHQEGVGKIPLQGRPQADGETTSDKTGQWMVVSPDGGSNGRVGITGVGGLHILPPEHSRTVNCDQAHCIPVSGGGRKDRVKGVQSMVGSGRLGLGGDVDDGLGGKTDGQGEVDGQDGDKDRLNWWGVYCSKRNLKGGA